MPLCEQTIPEAGTTYQIQARNPEDGFVIPVNIENTYPPLHYTQLFQESFYQC